MKCTTCDVYHEVDCTECGGSCQCAYCCGTGDDPSDEDSPCPCCVNGICDTCGGKGRIPCPDCHGTGFVGGVMDDEDEEDEDEDGEWADEALEEDEWDEEAIEEWGEEDLEEWEK